VKLVIGLGGKGTDEFVQSEELDHGFDGFAGFGAQPHDFQACQVDLLGQLIDRDIRRCTDKNLT
jgi:hypothetical protein